MTKADLAVKAKMIMSEGFFEAFLEEVKQDIALTIVHTQPHQKEEREEWYALHRAVNGLKGKLQGYADDYDKTQENDE